MVAGRAKAHVHKLRDAFNTPYAAGRRDAPEDVIRHDAVPKAAVARDLAILSAAGPHHHFEALGTHSLELTVTKLRLVGRDPVPFEVEHNLVKLMAEIADCMCAQQTAFLPAVLQHERGTPRTRQMKVGRGEDIVIPDAPMRLLRRVLRRDIDNDGLAAHLLHAHVALPGPLHRLLKFMPHFAQLRDLLSPKSVCGPWGTHQRLAGIVFGFVFETLSVLQAKDALWVQPQLSLAPPDRHD